MDLAPPGGWGLSQNSVHPGGPIWAGNGTKQGTTQLAWEAGVSPSSLLWQILFTIYGMKTSREKEKGKKNKEIGKGLKKKIPKDSLNKTYPAPSVCLTVCWPYGAR